MDVPTRYGYIDRYHATRRTAILKGHPELRSFMRVDPSFKYVALMSSATQILVAYLLRDSSLGQVIMFACVVGTLFDCTICNAIHETIHELAIPGSTIANKAFGIVINCALGWPAAGGYYTSHRNHHAYLGTNLDAKYPSVEEAAEYDQDVFSRIKFILGHPLSFGARWSLYVKQPDTEYAKWCFRLVYAFDLLILYAWGYKSVVYLLVSFWINDSFFIQGAKNFADHRMDDNKQSFTNSYYGSINMINFNIGYHREHHDLPNIPGRYQPQVTKVASEFYSDPRFIATNLFKPIFEVLTAEPGKGLMNYANKLVT